MNEKDDIILEYLAEIGVAEPLQVIYFNLKERGISFSKSTARRRLERLEEADLVTIAREKGTYYEISDKGFAYLEGEFKPEELEHLSLEDLDADEVEDLD